MSNGSEACCILGICCPPQSAQQASALSLAIKRNCGCTDVDALAVATWVTTTFDLAPAGTLHALKMAVKDLVEHKKP